LEKNNKEEAILDPWIISLATIVVFLLVLFLKMILHVKESQQASNSSTKEPELKQYTHL
jgi:flagellar basal body-associated protein FliL